MKTPTSIVVPCLKSLAGRCYRAFIAASCLIMALATAGTRASADSVTAAQAQRIVSQYSASFTSPGSGGSNEAPNGGALLGNGNLGVVIVNPIDTMTFLLGKNEFWSLNGGQVEPMASMALSIPGMSGASFAMQENIYTGTVTGQFSLNGNKIQTTSWVSSNDTTNNFLFTQFTYSGSGTQAVTVSMAVIPGNTYPTSSGSSGSVLYFNVAADSTATVGGYNTRQVRVAAGVVGATGTISGNTLKFTLTPGVTVTLVSSIMSNYDNSSYTTQSISNVSGSTASSISSELAADEAWWSNFWSVSYVEFGNNPALQKEYYGSLYLLASSSEPNTAPPGLWGPWVEANPAWAGDYTTDYNYETPPLAEFPTNHVALANSYDGPVITWLPKAESFATSSGFTGALYPAHIGPLPNGSYETGSGTLNIKSNGAFLATAMLQHYYVTQSAAYATTIWPTIQELATFYQNYLTWNGTSYDDLNDSQVENDPYPQTNGTMSLGFIRNLFQGAINLSTALGESSSQRSAWQHVLDNLTTYNGLTSTTGGLPYPTFTKNGLQVFANEQVGDQWAANGDEVWGITTASAIGLGSSPTLLTIARNTIQVLGPGALQVMWYPAAARVGYSPSTILSDLNSFVSNQAEPNLYVNVNGGGIENQELVPATISEMLMQSFQGNIILFPNWPSNTNAHFGDNLAYGNFLVSSAIDNNAVLYARIISQAGQTVSITNPWPGQSAQFYRNGTNEGTLSGTTFSIPTSTNDVLLLAPSGASVATINSEMANSLAQLGGNGGPGSVLPYNVNAIYTNGTTFSSSGGADSVGNAYSATLLGATQTFNGSTFTYGPSNAPDAFTNVTVALKPGSFSSLNILAYAISGDQASQTFQVNYTNNTYSTATQSISDWGIPGNYSGETKVATMAYRNTSSGGENNGTTTYVYGYTIPVTSGLTVESITLPANNNVRVLGIQDAATSATESPYSGTPAAVPGTVQAENYDTGGQGLAYNVTSINGTDNGYRSDGVDLEATSDTGGGVDLGWTTGGQWFKYTVNVATAGTYTVSFRVAAPAALTDAFHLSNSSGTNLSGSVAVPATGGYQTWATVTASVTLPAGQQTLTLNEDNVNWNINYMSFAQQIPTYTITASATSNGSISPSGSIKVNQGASQSFTISPNSGYSVSSVTVDGSNVGAVTSYTFSNVTANHTISAAFQSSGGGGGCVTATTSNSWQNSSMASQTGTFTATFDATPSASPTNSVVALSNGAQTAYANFACLARFNPSGDIDARNGGAYAAASTIPYSAGVSYHFRLVVNISAQTYSIYVTPAGGSELTVGLNYTFRISDTTLNYWGVFVDSASGGAGTDTVCNFSAGGGSVTTYTITASAGSNGSISPSGSVSVNSGASQSFTITPSSGYNVSSVTVDGASVGAVTSYTFSNVTANHSISAAFQQQSSGEGPYGGTPAAIPGTVQAENYDTGGQGVAYNVTSINGTDNSYRSDGVDLEATSDTGGGVDLGWTSGGQWFKYTVNVATAGTYTVSFRVAAPAALTDAFHLSNSSGTNLSGSVAVPATGGYQTWATVTASVTLPAGQQTLTLNEDNVNWNINYLAFASTTSPQTSTPSFSPGSGTYSSAQNVTINDSTSGASIRYTTDGSAPSETNGTIYSGPVNISSSTTLNAIAYKSGDTDSSITSATYTISAPPPPAAVGATTPFVSYEAEAGTLGGGATVVSLTSPPTTQYSSPALEASGHAYVQLTNTGQYVQWTNNTGQNITAINLRSCIPDAPNGGGITSTIDLYVDGVFRQAFSVNSQQNYCYEGLNYNDQTNKNPSAGDPRDFWNDTHAFITGNPVAPGSTIRFQKDSANSAAFYYIDVVDVENPPPPLTQPANSLSITSYGAVANNSSADNTSAINNCFSAAQSQGKIAWIPSGTFYFSAINGGLQASGITIEGAGPWYSTLYRVTPPNNTQGTSNIITATSTTLENVLLDCNGSSRATNNNDGAVDFSGSDWLVNNVWIQHVTSSFWCAGNNGMAENCRTLSVWSDGGNFNNVQDSRGIGTNLTYYNNFVRGTGDDAMAINSVNYDGSTYLTTMSNITYENNTAVAPWGGKCIGIYGGSNITVKNNLLSDTARYLGLGVMRFGTGGSDLLSATVTGNILLRCGGNGYNQQQQAMMIGNGGDGQSVGTVENAYVGSNTITDALYDAVGFSSSLNIVLHDNVINSPGLNGIAFGNATIDLGTVSGCAVLLNNTVNNLNSGQVAVATQSGTSYQVYTPILAASFSTESGVQTENCSEGGLDVGFIINGSYTVYNQVNLNGIVTFVARVASAGSGGNIEIHLDSPTGTLVGTSAVPVTGGWQTWADTQCSISSASGTHNVYLVFTGGAGNLFNVQWFSLTQTKSI